MNQSRKRPAVTEVEEFVDRDLRKDGVLMLRIIAGGAGTTVGYDVVEALWKKYSDKRNTRSTDSQDNDSSAFQGQQLEQVWNLPDHSLAWLQELRQLHFDITESFCFTFFRL